MTSPVRVPPSDVSLEGLPSAEETSEATSPLDDDAAMEAAILEAIAAGDDGDVPIGAVIVRNGRIVGRGRNRREIDGDPTAHAEIVALREAAAAAGEWRLLGATVYSTLEPCPMCAGALVNARVSRVVYGCPDPKAGAIDSLFQIGRDVRLNHRFEVEAGVLSERCAGLLKSFFAAKRRRT